MERSLNPSRWKKTEEEGGDASPQEGAGEEGTGWTGAETIQGPPPLAQESSPRTTVLET